MTAEAVAAVLLAAACAGGDGDEAGGPATTRRRAGTTTTTAAATPSPSPPAADGPVVAAAGDIACAPGQPPRARLCRMQDTAELVAAAGPEAVLTLGDNQYEDGALEKFQRSYEASWGRFKAVTRPSPGNHEYSGGRPAGYFGYFGDAAGPAGRGWYSFDVGAWHVVSLNSNCGRIGGCEPGSPQHRWLVQDLAASRARCTLAYWHHPRFSSGYHGDDASVGPLWDALYDAGADVVLGGHDHHYERLAPLSPAGTVDEQRGLRSFVVGTGGRSLYPTLVPRTGSQVRQAHAFGVLLLTLADDGYSWRFAPVPGSDFSDAGSGTCH